MKMKPKKIVTFTSSGNELISVCTSYLIDGIAFMLFRGLITLKTLNDLILSDYFSAKNSITPETAITKSTIFQPSLK